MIKDKFKNSLIRIGSICLLILPTLAYANANFSRSIAQIQEKEFDKSLERYRRCYGVKLSYANTTESRRRACKAFVLHKLNLSLSSPGTFFNVPMTFECRNTTEGHTRWWDWKSNPVIRLKPNQEYKVIDAAIADHLQKSDKTMAWTKAQDNCNYILNCRKALMLKGFTFELFQSCFLNTDAHNRKIMREEFLAKLFGNETEGMLIMNMLIH